MRKIEVAPASQAPGKRLEFGLSDQTSQVAGLALAGILGLYLRLET